MMRFILYFTKKNTIINNNSFLVN